MMLFTLVNITSLYKQQLIFTAKLISEKKRRRWDQQGGDDAPAAKKKTGTWEQSEVLFVL